MRSHSAGCCLTAVVKTDCYNAVIMRRGRVLFYMLVIAFVALMGCKEEALPEISPLPGTPDPEIAASPTPKPTVTGSLLIIASDGGSAVSEDGWLTLDIPPGALAEDTHIRVQSVPQDELPPDLQGINAGEVGYRLEPPGLVFAEPVEVRMTVKREDLAGEEGALGLSRLMVWSEGSEPEPLKDIKIEDSGGSALTISGWLTHLSLLFRDTPLLRGRLQQPEPRTQAISRTFQVYSSAMPLRPFPVISGMWIEFFVSDHLEIMDVKSNTRFWSSQRRQLGGPRRVRSLLIDFFSGTLISQFLELRCVEPGIAFYFMKVGGVSETEVGTDELEVSLAGVVDCIEVALPLGDYVVDLNHRLWNNCDVRNTNFHKRVLIEVRGSEKADTYGLTFWDGLTPYRGSMNVKTGEFKVGTSVIYAGILKEGFAGPITFTATVHPDCEAVFEVTAKEQGK